MAAKIEFRTIPSADHPAASSNIPIFQHNMVPLEALSLGAGRTVDEFADALKEQIEESMRPGAESDGSNDEPRQGSNKLNGTRPSL
jgi:hypothetical protein